MSRLYFTRCCLSNASQQWTSEWSLKHSEWINTSFTSSLLVSGTIIRSSKLPASCVGSITSCFILNRDISSSRLLSIFPGCEPGKFILPQITYIAFGTTIVLKHQRIHSRKRLWLSQVIDIQFNQLQQVTARSTEGVHIIKRRDEEMIVGIDKFLVVGGECLWLSQVVDICWRWWLESVWSSV